MRFKLWFEWGGGSIWSADDGTSELYDIGPVEDRLPLTPAARATLDELSARHDTKLDWSNPSGPALWSAAEKASFDADVVVFLKLLRAELGPHFDVEYEPL